MQNPLLKNNKILSFRNCWVDDIFEEFKLTGLDLNKPIHLVIDIGYGDIVSRMNYLLWLSEIVNLKVNFIIKKQHTFPVLKNKESLVEKVHYLFKLWKCNIQYDFDIVDHKTWVYINDKKHNFRYKRLDITEEWKNLNCNVLDSKQIWHPNLRNPLQTWYQFKDKQWSGKNSKKVSIYQFWPADWNLLKEAVNAVGDKVMDIVDENTYVKYYERLNRFLSLKYDVVNIDYSMTPEELINHIQTSAFVVSARGAVPYLAQCMNVPMCMIIKNDHLRTAPIFNTKNNVVFSTSIDYISNLHNEHEDFKLKPKHKYTYNKQSIDKIIIK